MAHDAPTNAVEPTRLVIRNIGLMLSGLEVARRVLAPLSAAEQETLIALLHRIGDGDDDFV